LVIVITNCTFLVRFGGIPGETSFTHSLILVGALEDS